MGRLRKAEDEYDTVEDSEPEREERRKRQRGNLKCRHDEGTTESPSAGSTVTQEKATQSDGLLQEKADPHSSPEVVTGRGFLNQVPSQDFDVPTNHHERSPPGACNLHISERPGGDGAGACATRPAVAQPASTHIASHNVALTRSICPSLPLIATIETYDLTSDSEREDQISLMRISRFAYQPPTSKHPKHPPKPSNSSQSNKPRSDVCEPGPSRPIDDPKPKKSASKRVSDDFSDSQLMKLLKCVGCELQWTSRKTAKQKRLHIEQCAKKNSLTEDTVRILIRKEIGISTSSQDASSSKDGGASRDTHNENAAVTLMDSVVPDERAKKSRRQQVVPTVRSLPETRESILGRARDVLGSSARFQADPHDAAAGPPSKSHLEVQPTQPFGRSLLACRNTGDPPNILRSAPHSMDQAMEAPAPTQAFGVSALRARGPPTKRIVEAHTEPFPLQTQQFGASKLAQGLNSRSETFPVPKRSLSPPPLAENDRTVRPRLVQ
ncbi:hypothetical protein HYDPIDRAFT_23239 [Hydnomerulius pinastri MD-312]|nr:hypothetical protein HYDPIDRAFT_23239 [Hydnomerulius pinastri MD-312]